MLFYETEGQFGDEDFKVTAKGLFLLDIGTATYTEYNPADAELIKFLSNNPSYLAMKKGHIHSHNNMGVFFSTTDDDELVDNCGFHNFYVSLIVNNRNEMCAKIAFKAKVISENNITMTFLDQTGNEKNKKVVNTNEGEGVYVYKCKVLKEEKEVVEDSFKSRFQEVKESKAKRLAEAAAIRSKALKGHVGFEERWRQAGLFEDFAGPNTMPKGRKEEDIFYERPRKGVPSMVERSGYMRTDPRVHSMLSKLIAVDFLYEGSLQKILKKMNEEFYPEVENVVARDSYAPHLYYDAIEARAIDFYMDSFPEDFNLLGFNKAMEDAVDLLELYEDDYPELVSNLRDSISLEIK